MAASVSMPVGGVQVGSYGDYAQAQRAVDFLSDEQFPVENVQIVGTDLRTVEQVVGRLTLARAAMAGAASGAWFGLFVGLLLGIFAPDGSSWISSVLTGLVIGLVFGALFGAASFAATRGRRDFAAAPQRIVAGRYDVLCQPQAAEQARELLARLSLRG
ncbi:hypothetical protein ASG36_05535 [Geodermatophilus sp. Leaf369]|jgi:hypothetical protein|uniref:general stress protein n=1 Tax=Geodermatophilus sp. Leaf369 TaxID=1736354 RepID=UPI0006F264AD|nr:general stress protein [Geodermatophilus sp. Leaf369]KQS60395.1 hypothetical protein ASG36_05535 [Geodermatophilus sp. Leaf369]